MKFFDDYGADAHHRGVSFTRSPAVAADFAHSQEEAFLANYGSDDDYMPKGVILEYDRTKLARQAGLVVVDDAGGDREQEERTRVPLVPPFAALIAIHVDADDLAWYASLLTNPETKADFPSEYQAAMTKLKSMRLVAR